MATAGIALAMIIAVPLGLIISYSLSISRIGPTSDHQFAQSVRFLARSLMLVLRGIPEIVWALLLVRVFGLGAIAGVLAIAITYGGMLAKVYSEILESGNTLPACALILSGSNRITAFLYGLLPGSAQELASYTVYRWECAVRASVVMGFVGAGGLGQLMDQSMKMLNGGEVSTILVVFLGLVLLADYISLIIRKQLA
jgi:phosphonate transport system permease protein